MPESYGTAMEAIKATLDRGGEAIMPLRVFAGAESTLEEICRELKCSAFMDWKNETIIFERAN